MAEWFHQVLPSADLGGGNLVALNLASHLRDRGLRPTVWVPGEGASAEQARGRGLTAEFYLGDACFNGGRPRHLLASLDLVPRLRRRTPGLVHTHSPLCYGSLSWALRASGLARVVHVQIEEDHEGLRWALQRPPELILTCARFLVDHVRRCLPEAQRQTQWIEAVPNCVDLERFHPGDREESRRRVGAPPGWPLLLMLANLSPHKGQETAIRAVHELKKRGRDVLCWLAGEERGGGTAYTGRLRGLIDELGVGDRVRLLGFRGDAPDLLRACDFFLLPSTHEGLPLTVLEAQATRVPVLASATAGIPEVVRDGHTGFLLSPAEPAAYAACVDRLLREPSLARQVADEAFAYTAREHSWKGYCDRVRELYDELLTRTGVVRGRERLAPGAAGQEVSQW